MPNPKMARILSITHLNSPAYMVPVAVTLLMFCVLFYSCTRTLVDPDLYWHLKVGFDMLQHGSIVNPDTYSFLSFDQRWINHEWLCDLLFGSLYWHLGWAALVLFKAFIAALMLVVAYKYLARWELDSFVAGLILLMVAFFASPATNCIRPHIFSCLFIAIELVLLRIAATGKQYVFWCFPILFALWVNLHGGFMIGLSVLTTWTLLESFAYLRKQHKRKKLLIFYWFILALSCLATLFNPYGYALHQWIINFLMVLHPAVSEWQPIQLVSQLGVLWAIALSVTLSSLLISKSPKDLNCLVLWVIFAIAPLVSIRHLQFFGIATASLVGEHLVATWQLRKQQTKVDLARKWSTADLVFIGLSSLVSIWLTTTGISQITQLRLVPGEDVPEHAVALLKQIKAQGNMIVSFDWGGYVIWYLAPSVKVSHDGRMECVYSSVVSDANLFFTSGTGPWDSLLKKFPVDMVLVRTTTPSFNLMKLRPDWKLIYEDDLSALFFPSNSSQARRAEELLHSLSNEEKSKVLTLPLL